MKSALWNEFVSPICIAAKVSPVWASRFISPALTDMPTDGEIYGRCGPEAWLERVAKSAPAKGLSMSSSAALTTGAKSSRVRAIRPSWDNKVRICDRHNGGD